MDKDPLNFWGVTGSRTEIGPVTADVITWTNGIGFLVVGLGMLGLSILAPRMASAPAVFGTNARELWLFVMGSINTALGAGGLGWRGIGRVRRSIPVWFPAPNEVPAQLQPVLRVSASAAPTE